MTAIPHPPVVLLVDDDENDVLLIRRALSRLFPQARLLAVNTGQQAISCLQGTGDYVDRRVWPKPSVVLLDYWMPQVGGLEVLCWLRTYPPLANLPVVVFSGGLTPGQIVVMDRLGAVCYDKQADFNDTVKALDKALKAALKEPRHPPSMNTWQWPAQADLR